MSMTRWFLVVVTLLGVLGVRGLAQTAPAAPEGNAHPQAQGVSEQGRGKPNPFGDVARSSDASVADKAAFAKQLDLSVVRDLAVFHSTRVKIVDSLAREMVEEISGRKSLKLPSRPLQEVAAGNGYSPGAIAKQDSITGVAFDPVFTLLDMMFDPAFYFDQPLVGINYLPLREELLEIAIAGKDEGSERVRKAFMRTARVTPRMVDASGSAIRSAHPGERQYLEAMAKAEHHLMMFVDARANLQLVAPQRSTDSWLHLADLPPDHPARVAALSLGEAWRARDAGRANDALRALAKELPSINPEVYPQGRRGLELTYNRARLFEWGWVLYCLSLVTLLLAFGTQRSWLAWGGGVLLSLGAVAHLGGFVLRGVIAQRYAIQNQFESMTGISLFAVLLAMGLMLKKGQWLYGAAAAAVGFMTLVTATQAAIPGEFVQREAAILNTSVLLKYHVTTVLVSYGLIALGFVLSMFYLGVHYVGRGRVEPGAAVLLPVGEGEGAPPATASKALDDLDKAQLIVLQLAFWTLGVGILLGGWWADHSWGRWWAWDPKETWALVTWIVYLIVIHLRFARPRSKGLTTAWLSVAGFVVMLWTYFGVNLLLPGLHAYA